MLLSAAAVRAGIPFAHRLDPDELEHLHGAWSIAHGQWPYRDYFEHHMPWLHLALAPLVRLLDVDRDPQAAVAGIFAARGAMWVLGTLAIALTGWLGALWNGTRTGWTAAALLTVSIAFTHKMAEVRPDVPAVVCLLGAWIACLKGWRAGAGGGAMLATSGLLAGAAVLFTQKALFTGPAWAAVFAWWLAAGPGLLRARLRGAILFAAAALLPLLATLTLFELNGGARRFLEMNLALNARWPVRLSPLPMMERIALLDTALVALGALGLLRAAPRALTAEALVRGEAFILAHFAGLAVGAFVIPIALLQYFTMVLPLLALLAAGGLGFLADRIAMGGAAADPRRDTRASLVLAVALVAVALAPLAALARGLSPARPVLQEQLARIRFVQDHTAPGETVLDGFTGAGVFRPHAWYYFFLHGEIRALLGAPEIGRLQAELRDGSVAPALVVFDDDLRQMHEEVTSFLRANYEPFSDPIVWRRKPLELDGPLRGRLDLASAPGDALAGRGWAPPTREGDRTVRLTQGRRSTVRLPLFRPADARVVVRARAEAPPPGGRVGLHLNDTFLGEEPAAEGWRDYTFAAPASVWRRGVNRLRLTHSAAPAGPAERGEGAPVVLAVDEVLLSPPAPIDIR